MLNQKDKLELINKLIQYTYVCLGCGNTTCTCGHKAYEDITFFIDQGTLTAEECGYDEPISDWQLASQEQCEYSNMPF